MSAEPGCCQGCVPANRLAVAQIDAERPLKLGTDLPQLAVALRSRFVPEETAKLLGGSCRRFLQASVG